jgi:hypothetical protein
LSPLQRAWSYIFWSVFGALCLAAIILLAVALLSDSA